MKTPASSPPLSAGEGLRPSGTPAESGGEEGENGREQELKRGAFAAQKAADTAGEHDDNSDVK